MEAVNVVGIFLFLGVAVIVAGGISYYAFNFDLFGYLYHSILSLFDSISNYI